MNKWRVEKQDNITNIDNTIANSSNILQKTENVEMQNVIVVKRLGTAHEPIKTKQESFYYDGYFFYHCIKRYKKGYAYYWYMRAESERKLYYVGKQLPPHLTNRKYE